MPETNSISSAGEELKELRLRLGMTTRDVTDLSRKIVDSEGNEEFHISNNWLSNIENSESVPSIYKLYSLSVIYHVKFGDLLQLYGVDVQKISKLQIEMPLPQTHLTPIEVFDEAGAVTFPIAFDRGFDRGKTNLLSRMVEIWGEVPIAVIRHLDVRHSMYGYIGLEDRTLYPLLRPGSFVQIDPRIKTSSAGLQKKFELEMRLAAAITQSSTAVMQARSVQEQVIGKRLRGRLRHGWSAC